MSEIEEIYKNLKPYCTHLDDAQIRNKVVKRYNKVLRSRRITINDVNEVLLPPVKKVEVAPSNNAPAVKKAVKKAKKKNR